MSEKKLKFGNFSVNKQEFHNFGGFLHYVIQTLTDESPNRMT